MKCNNCGSDISNNSNFCSYCGSKVEFEDSFISTYEDRKESEQLKPVQEPRFVPQYVETRNASNWWCVLGFLFPLLGFILFYVMIMQKPLVAFKLRKGAFFGILVELVLAFIYVIFQYR